VPGKLLPENLAGEGAKLGAGMQLVTEWLEKLGLGEYAQHFADNGIDFSVLRDLTDQDLKDIGVLLGHRRKMLRAISELADGPAELEPASPTDPESRESAERRQLTVMFCDLVESTELSTRLDPEDLREVISTYRRCCHHAVAKSRGFVAIPPPKRLESIVGCLFRGRNGGPTALEM
jgi:SAM domain (Sterile alpha motif)